MQEIELTQTSTLKGSERFFSPKDLLASSASFLLDKATPVIFTLLVSLGFFLIGVGLSISSLNLKVAHLETQVNASVSDDKYDSDQTSLVLQLENIKALIEQGNDRTERIEDYLLNSKE